MAECDENITSMNLCWDLIKTLRAYNEEQKVVLWADLNAGELEDDVNEASEQAYVELVEFVKLSAITLFTELNANTQQTYH